VLTNEFVGRREVDPSTDRPETQRVGYGLPLDILGRASCPRERGTGASPARGDFSTTANAGGLTPFRDGLIICAPGWLAGSWAMPALPHRRCPERQDCWHLYYGNVHMGTIARRAGCPAALLCGLRYPDANLVRNSVAIASLDGSLQPNDGLVDPVIVLRGIGLCFLAASAGLFYMRGRFSLPGAPEK
jgi:hypothetical protein